MEIKLLALRLRNGPKLPNAEIVAHADLEIGGDLLIRDAALALCGEDYRVLPPRIRGKSCHVGWRRDGPLAMAVNATVKRAYFSITGKEAG